MRPNCPATTAFMAIPALLLAAFAPAQGQIKFTDAYPKTKFAEPVYFGAFPGKPKTNVVLEQHKGNALLVYANASGWIKDTLVHIDVHQGGEMGLLGIAFHPDFNSNHKYYVSYDPPDDLFNIVEERIADATGMKDSGTKGRVLFKIEDPYENHNGGTIAFGPKDGFLYYGTGDGGSGNDPKGNGQNVNALLAKMLRIDVDKKDAGLEYGIPADNPFAKGGGRAEIFAYGFRNPWKWSFDPLNGDLWVGDVGQDAIEEVDIVTLGKNYGWKTMEGPLGSNPGGNFTLPVFSYDRGEGSCIIGGVVYRGHAGSKYYGTYFVADIGSLRFWSVAKNGTGLAAATKLDDTPTRISSFGTDAEGRIYACGLNNGIIYYLDSPDLTPNVSLRPEGSLLGKYRRIWSAHPGGRLEARVFAGSPVLEIFGVGGSRLGALRAADPALPPNMDSGVYLLRPTAGKGLPDLLMVR